MKNKDIFHSIGLFFTYASFIIPIQISFGGTSIAHAASCAQIDPTHVDSDGMPFCPAVVEQESAWSVYSCAIDQAKSFHFPTSAEVSATQAMLSAFEQSKTSGISSTTTQAILSNADKLGLQACRVKTTTTLNGATAPDSYLLIYTKPGVTDYSGAFFMLRETTSSKIVLIGPHDDSDGTYADTKIGLAKSHALALISNGHKRNAVGLGQYNDFVHASPSQNLGTKALEAFFTNNRAQVVLHIHGMQNPDHVLDRSRSPVLQKAFEDAVVKYTKILSGNFAPLNASFTIDSLVNTNDYLKTEMPAVIHINNHSVIADIANYIETFSWAW